MDMPARAFCQPVANNLRFVSGIIVHDQMDVEISGNIALDLIEEFAELARPVSWIAFTDHLTGRDIERCKQ